MVVSGLAAATGHCFPIFAHFKGGKAVATMYGFLFGMALIGGYSFWIFFLPLLAFLVILYIGKIVAVASVGSAVINTIYIYFALDSFEMFAASFVFAIFNIRNQKTKNLTCVFFSVKTHLLPDPAYH